MNLGYACINHGLSTLPKSKRVTTNRSMIKKTFKERGTTYASEIALQNVTDLLTILQWNVNNDIRFFRMSSDIFPWASEYSLEQLPDFNAISDILRKCGDFATQHDIRLTTHPGPYNKLCSSDERIINNTVKDLNHHAEVMDLMGLSATPYNKINIHVGATYGDKPAAGEVFCRNFDRLSDTCKQRLTVENDDKASMWSTRDLYEMVYRNINIPIVFDYHHHQFCTGDQTEQEALALAASTWGDVVPVVHYSQSRSEEHNDPTIKPQAHSDSYWSVPELYGINVDVMLECKLKEQGLQKMRQLITEGA